MIKLRYKPYRKKKSYNSVIIAIILGLFLAFSFYQNLFGFRYYLLSAFYPFQFIANQLWKGVLGIPTSISNLRNLAKENARLREQVQLISVKLSPMEELRSENDRLRAALGFKARVPFQLIPAQVIGKEGLPVFSVLIVNRGKTDGVKENMPVLVGTGLVGKVVEVSFYTAKVATVINSSCRVAALDQRSRVFGVVEGDYSGYLRFKYVPISADITEGDKIVTSSISSFFPSGIPIGTISQVVKREGDLFCQIAIKPFVDVSRLEEVFIIR